MKVIFLKNASLEFRDAVKYYNTERQGLGFEFANEVKASLTRIKQYPEIWIEIDTGIRKCIVKRFPYAILYTVDDDLVIIVAVMHMKRMPSYWKERIDN